MAAKGIESALAKLRDRTHEETVKLKLGILADIEKTLEPVGFTLQDLLDARDGKTRGAKRGPKPGAKAGVTAGAKTRKPPFKGKQPARYQDPKTGATWSGMGRAPAWIVNASNRDKFLIAKA